MIQNILDFFNKTNTGHYTLLIFYAGSVISGAIGMALTLNSMTTSMEVISMSTAIKPYLWFFAPCAVLWSTKFLKKLFSRPNQ